MEVLTSAGGCIAYVGVARTFYHGARERRALRKRACERNDPYVPRLDISNVCSQVVAAWVCSSLSVSIACCPEGAHESGTRAYLQRCVGARVPEASKQKTFSRSPHDSR